VVLPVADLFIHSNEPTVYQNIVDPSEFLARSNLTAGDLITTEYAKASDLEMLIRYGFKPDDNEYGSRQFELMGEPTQAGGREG